MIPSEFLRYSCQLALPGFNEATQLRLQSAKVLIVGMGGLGCPAAQYLTATGIGTIGIADFDTVSLSNLHRQILYSDADIGAKKVVVAGKKLQQQNPQITIAIHDVLIGSENVMDIIGQYDIVVDCTDNFDTRYLLNDACVLSCKPLVYGAIFQYEGQVALWNVPNPDGTHSANYRNLFPSVNAAQIPNCAEGGVIPTLAGIIGCMQANEVIKYITNTGEVLGGKILVLDAQTLQSRIINISKISKTEISGLEKTAAIPTISVHNLKISIHENWYQLIDVRSIEEHTAFNIGGLNIPLKEIANDLSFLNSDKSIVFYCQSGKRSAEAVKLILSKYPSANVCSLSGGIKSWKEQEQQGQNIL